jgi:hypothetical protein
MGFKTIHDFPESTNPSGDWYVLVDDGTGCYKKVKLSNLPGGGSVPTSTTTSTTTAAGGSTTTSTTTVAASTTSTTTTSAEPNPEANAYFAALASAGYNVNETEENAIIEFIDSLKSEGIYEKFIAIYPMLGSTYASMKWNMVNPVDSNGAFRLTQVGSITFSSTGATADVSSAFNTHIVPSNEIAYNSNSMGLYLRTNYTLGPAYDMGVYIGEDNSTFKLLFIAADDETFSRSGNGAGLATVVVSGVTDARGFWINNRESDEENRLYRNGVIQGSVNTTQVLPANFPDYSLYLGGVHGVYNDSTEYTVSGRKQVCFGYVADTALTSLEIGIVNSAVTSLVTALGRNV